MQSDGCERPKLANTHSRHKKGATTSLSRGLPAGSPILNTQPAFN